MREKLYQISSPPVDWKYLLDKNLIGAAPPDPRLQEAVARVNQRYLHWEEIRLRPSLIPTDIFPEKELFWSYIKANRMFKRRELPIRDENGHSFFINTEPYAEFLHIIDKEMAGNFMGVPDITESQKRQLVMRNTIEEAIASSRLEGANTSRAAAKQLLMENRKPRDYGEKMIVNNHRAMELIEKSYRKQALSWEMICELHCILTQDTLPDEKQGVLRETHDEKGNRLVIKPWDDLTIAYVTPSKEFVREEIPKLINFANDQDTGSAGFIHPLLKAILLHFWVGLLHPFEDGNGRLARALFYWYMLRHDYWAFAYLSLSEKIIRASKQYAMAYIFSEQDDNDVTYFVHYNIHKLTSAREEFQRYLHDQLQKNQLTISSLQRRLDLNERQIRLLQYLSQKSGRRTTLVTHQNLYDVTPATAAADLNKLVGDAFLERKKHGRNVYYYPTAKAESLFT